MTASLLRASDARIDGRGAVLLDELSFDTDGDRLGLVGDFGALFSFFLGLARLVRGTVELEGADPGELVRANVAFVVSFELPLPAPWTLSEYLVENARLAGLGRRAAARAARESLESTGLGRLGKVQIGALDPADRRALALANALLAQPRILLVDRPFFGLELRDAEKIDAILRRATTNRRLVVCVPNLAAIGPDAKLLASMDHAVVLVGGKIVGSGPPGELLRPSSAYVVRASKCGAELAGALAERGVSVEPFEIANGAGAVRLVVHLPDGGAPSAIIDAASSAGAPLLEMVPIAQIVGRGR